MSVIVTLRLKGDPQRLESFAASKPDEMRSIVNVAKEHGVIAHRFYGSEDGQILVVDEWPDSQSFQSFFDSTQDRIGSMMQESSVSGEPEITFWRKLETHDEVGWGS